MNNYENVQPNVSDIGVQNPQIQIKPDSDLIIEPEDSKDVSNYRLFQ